MQVEVGIELEGPGKREPCPVVGKGDHGSAVGCGAEECPYAGCCRQEVCVEDNIDLLPARSSGCGAWAQGAPLRRSGFKGGTEARAEGVLGARARGSGSSRS